MFLKRFGIVLLPLSILYYFLIDGVSYLSIFFFLLGMVFIGLASLLPASVLSFKRQLVLALSPFLLLLAYIIWFNRPYNQKIIVPDNFRGLMVLAYGQPKGKEVTWEGFYRIIHLSSSGVAATQSVWSPSTDNGTDFFFKGNTKESIPFYYQSFDFSDTTKKYIFTIASSSDCRAFVLETEARGKTYFEDAGCMHAKAWVMFKINQINDSIQNK